MNPAIEFLHQVEADPDLRARMEAADGDLDTILRIARDAGHTLDREHYLRACQEITERADGAGSPVEFGHPIVYFGHPIVYFGHPIVYFGEQPTAAPAAQ